MKGTTTFFIIKGARLHIAIGAVRINEGIRNRGPRRGAFGVAYHGAAVISIPFEHNESQKGVVISKEGEATGRCKIRTASRSHVG